MGSRPLSRSGFLRSALYNRFCLPLYGDSSQPTELRGRLSFVRDAFIDGDISIVRLGPEDMAKVVDVMQKFNLDFDDAYQYVVAERYGFTIVSFDGYFDRTERGRKVPKDLLEG